VENAIFLVILRKLRKGKYPQGEGVLKFKLY
jgi:hypothetical protein